MRCSAGIWDCSARAAAEPMPAPSAVPAVAPASAAVMAICRPRDSIDCSIRCPAAVSAASAPSSWARPSCSAVASRPTSTSAETYSSCATAPPSSATPLGGQLVVVHRHFLHPISGRLHALLSGQLHSLPPLLERLVVVPDPFRWLLVLGQLEVAQDGQRRLYCGVEVVAGAGEVSAGPEGADVSCSFGRGDDSEELGAAAEPFAVRSSICSASIACRA